MTFPVFKGAGYILAHTPDMIVRNGTTCSVERETHPESEFLKDVEKNIRSYEEVVNYLPNQVYIGALRPEELRNYDLPWYDKEFKGQREAKFGEITPQDEFLMMIKVCDSFDLVALTNEFVAATEEKFKKSYPELEPYFNQIVGVDGAEARSYAEENHAEELYHNGEFVGYIKRAHDVDVNLTAHIMLENLVAKASGVIAAVNAIRHTDIKAEDIDYVIECSEEACGDMNQRGGGNFAKAIAEKVGLINASGSDTRGFCAAPAHAMINAAALVQAGVHKNVLVVSGGSTAKLGMNSRDHVKKGLPVLEDVVAGFALVVSENDGISPIVRTDLVGKHNVGTGSSPQAVMSSLVKSALDKGGLKITDVDVYSVEMQNPDITMAAGAGNVPEANYKMIGALAAMNKQIEKKQIKEFMIEKGLPGWAPTQGHIPSGAPYVGFAIEDMTSGDKNRAMIIGKGSLFLGRMTNLFDGLSFVIERNPGKAAEEDSQGSVISKEEIKKILADSIRKMAMNMTEE